MHSNAPLPMENHVRIFVGDVVTSTTPVVIETLLGSCVAVCLHDTELHFGGMNHILLAGSGRDGKSTRFGVYAMELLINEMMKIGGNRKKFVAKAFGGANIVQSVKYSSIGEDNAEFVRNFLETEKIPLISQRMGGTQPVHLDFRTDLGKATVHTVDGSQLHKIIQAEEVYKKTHSVDKNYSGEITLF
jgi:chemotaxis protein CheD